MNDYPVVVGKLSEKDGGGYIGIVPDLQGCMSDGETPAEALSNALAAIEEWIDEARRTGKAVPAPGAAAKRNIAKERALVKTIKDLAEAFVSLDGRIEKLEQSSKELSEQAENMDAWSRFAALTGFPPDIDEPKQLPC